MRLWNRFQVKWRVMGQIQSTRPAPAAWFALGFLATISQVLLLRDFLVLCGGSELGIALLLFIWLAGIGAGAALGRPLLPARGIPRSRLPLLLTALALSCPVGLATMRLAGLPAHLPAGSLLPLEELARVALLSVLPPALLTGIVFPLACAVESGATVAKPGSRALGAIGRVYALEAAGSFCAGMLHTWLLVTLLPAMQTALLSGALLCLSAVLLTRQPGGRDRHGAPLLSARLTALGVGLLMLTAGLTPALGGRLEQWTLAQAWQRKHPGIRLLETRETPYQRLAAGSLDDQRLITANGTLVAALPDPWTSTLTAHFLLSVHPNTRRVLLVGGLEAGLLPAMLRHPGIEEIRCLEQDPVLPRFHADMAGAEQRQARDDPRFKLEIGDGRRWINRASRSVSGDHGPYQLVVILLPDPTTTMINRYYTREFHQACQRLLTADGVLICRVTASANILQQEAGDLARSVHATLRQSFPIVRAAGSTPIYLAAAQEMPAADFFSAESLVRHYRASGTDDQMFSPEAFHTLVEEERTRYLDAQLGRRQQADPLLVNSDWRPMAPLHTLRLWSRFAGDDLERWHHWLFRPLPGWLPWTMAGLALVWAHLPLIRRSRRTGMVNQGSILPAVAVAGFAGLALELLCLQVYQGAFGTLYRMIGSVVACFMLGLALGSLAAAPLHRRLSPDRFTGRHRLLALGLTGQALVTLAAPAALLLAGSSGSPLFAVKGFPEGLMLLLVGAAGLFTGLALPAAGGMLADGPTGRSTGRASAMVNGLDHLGAAVAAALVGLAAIPRLGVTNSAVAVALMAGFCGLRLWLEAWTVSPRPRGGGGCSQRTSPPLSDGPTP